RADRPRGAGGPRGPRHDRVPAGQRHRRGRRPGRGVPPPAPGGGGGGGGHPRGPPPPQRRRAPRAPGRRPSRPRPPPPNLAALPPEAGAPVSSMLIARPFARPVTIDETTLHYLPAPAWDRMLKLPPAERVALLRDPAARAELRDSVEHYNRDPAKGTTVPPPLWDAVFVDEVAKPEHEKLQARSIREIADDQGVAPAAALLDLALDEDLAPRFR